MDWYVARDGERFGPFPFEVMIKGIRDGELKPQDLVWSQGAPDWQPASSVPGLFSPPSLSAPPPLLTASQPNDASQRGTEPGDPQAKADVGSSINENPSLIRRHWRGELSLGRAYWGVGVAVVVGAIGLQHFFAALVQGNGMGMLQFGMALTGLFAFIALCTLWQLVGVWRSAGRHMRSSQSRVPGAMARLTLILGVALVARDFGAVLGPFVVENWSPASRKADVATHELRLLRNGTEIELSGSLSEGTAIAVRQLLDAAPDVQVVHLNSAGGSVAEGYEIYQLIRDRKLITYTATDCVSACTIAFLGGSQRLLSTGARLGFHSANIRGVDQRYIPAINAEMRSTLMSHGVPESFVTKAFSTSADSMWYPTKSELAAANVVTGVVDPDQFALSGISNWRDQEAIERSLLTLPLYAIVRDNDPEMFKKIANRFAEGVRFGKSLVEITQDTQSVFASEIIPKYLMRASPGAVHRYWRTQVDEVRHLNETDPDSCVAYLLPQLRTPAYKLADLVPAHVLKADVDALTSLVEEAIRSPVSPTETKVDDDLQKILGIVSKRMPDAEQVIGRPLKYVRESSRVCTAFLAFYSEVLALPPNNSAAVVRRMLDQGH